MIRMIRVVGMTLVAMLAISGIASAHSFVAEKAGAVTRVTNKPQVFKTGSGSVAVTCNTDAVSNSNAAAGKQLTLTADVSYASCSILGGFFSATVTTAKYTFNADNTANLTNSVVINVPVAGCHITVKPQNTLKTITYKNTGKNVIVEPNVSGIVSEGTGGECGTASSTGTYTGTTEVTSSGNTISWE